MQIICNYPDHHFLLSMGQFCPWPLKATEAKYGKFAYSSHFGFSVPTGPLIQQIAPDSTLALSKDGGDTWRVPWKVGGDSLKLGMAPHRSSGHVSELIPSLSSKWRPWVDADIEVLTYLIAPSQRWPNWYIRWHRITNKGPSDVTIHAVQGGFAIQGRGHERGEVLSTHIDIESLTSKEKYGFPEGTLQTEDGVLICSDAGATGIRALDMYPYADCAERSVTHVQPEALKPDANTNLMWQRTLIPTIRLETDPTKRAVDIASAVFTFARTSNRAKQYDSADLAKLWNDVPILRNQEGGRPGYEDHYVDLN